MSLTDRSEDSLHPFIWILPSRISRANIILLRLVLTRSANHSGSVIARVPTITLAAPRFKGLGPLSGAYSASDLYRYRNFRQDRCYGIEVITMAHCRIEVHYMNGGRSFHLPIIRNITGIRQSDSFLSLAFRRPIARPFHLGYRPLEVLS